MRCWKCGRDLPPDSGFCNYCGAQTALAASPATPVTDTKEKSGFRLDVRLVFGGLIAVLLIAIIVTVILLLRSGGKLEPCTVKVYDSEGNLTQYYKRDAYDFGTEFWDGDGELQYKYKIKRDSRGRMLERKFYDGNGDFLGSDKFEYEGKKATSTNYDSSGDKEGYKTEWVFDNKNRPMELVSYSELGDRTSRTVIERDSHGNGVSYVTYSYESGDKITSTKLILDITYEGNRPVSAKVVTTYYGSGGQVESTEKNRYEYEY